jgi:hemerythrin-like domain-containing protein
MANKKSSTKDPVKILKDDHKKVKKLFKELENAKGPEKKLEIFEKTAQELEVHAKIEEDIFYPTVREHVGDDALMDEALQEHHTVKVLISEIQALAGDESNGDAFVAKCTVLQENVEHHIEEEETEMLPKVKEAEIDHESLAERMLQHKQELKAGGGEKKAA